MQPFLQNIWSGNNPIFFDTESRVHVLSYAILSPGFICVLKTFGFQKSDFKALKVLEIDFWSLEVLSFCYLSRLKNVNALRSLK